MKGKLPIFSAPSGSGKPTIVQHLLRKIPGLEFSISATSRKMRANEKNGKDYFFISSDDFRKKIENKEFLEWEEVYKDQYYGTLRSEVERIRNLGNHVIFDVDVVGALNIKKQYGPDAFAVFVKAPSYNELEKRLRMRSTEDELSFRKRMNKAKGEMSFSDKFDFVLVNSELKETLHNAEELVRNFLKK
jgi:guanylate kinase